MAHSGAKILDGCIERDRFRRESVRDYSDKFVAIS